MHQLFPLCLLVAAAVASPATYQMLETSHDKIIRYINNVANTTWKAGRNFHPSEMERINSLFGLDLEMTRAFNKKYLKYKEVVVRDDLPDHFDPTKKWPKCKSLTEVRDQSNCGSCWAFGSVEAMTDRICIKGGGEVHISAQDLTSCCSFCGNGCQGGSHSAAWYWYTTGGVVTGGQYGSNQGCMPYALPKCDHYVTGKYKKCPKVGDTPRCNDTCVAGYPKTYVQDKHYGNSTYGIKGVQQIAQELVDHGPVTAGINLYADFLTYKSGIYQHKTGSLLGAHAIKIIGYGVENGVEYWQATNSWNEDWGDKGFFKILKGKDESGVEELVIAGLPRL
ncbi:cathepsin B [Aplysia californica]|uniref:Cathepsin B n=1 Tax=Aplysia californica TaxID=6500 RepID=A0ABM1A1G3_APLCA|nr:cathepsin B [Aplysia californica]